jgi:hypothetical protein
MMDNIIKNGIVHQAKLVIKSRRHWHDENHANRHSLPCSWVTSSSLPWMSSGGSCKAHMQSTATRDDNNHHQNNRLKERKNKLTSACVWCVLAAAGEEAHLVRLWNERTNKGPDDEQQCHWVAVDTAHRSLCAYIYNKYMYANPYLWSAVGWALPGKLRVQCVCVSVSPASLLRAALHRGQPAFFIAQYQPPAECMP